MFKNKMNNIKNIKKPKAIFFDWDGTLVDSYSFLNDAHNHTMLALGFSPMKEGEYKKYFGKPREILYPILYGDKSEDAKIIFGEYVNKNTHKILSVEFAKELIESIFEMKIPMGIVSNKKSEFLQKEADHLGWRPYFRSFIGAGDAEEDKPSAAPLKLAVEKANINVNKLDDIWFVGDTENDMLCAKNYGCKSVFVVEGAPDLSLAKNFDPYLSVENCDVLQKILFQISR